MYSIRPRQDNVKCTREASKANEEAIRKAVAKGIHVCIASGRAFDTLPQDVVSIPGIEYAITSNGATEYRTSSVCVPMC